MYRFFARPDNGGMTPEQTDRLPLYLASVFMGAISPDHENLEMTETDMRRYAGMKKWKRKPTL